MTTPGKICGGWILFSKKMLASDIFSKPPLYFKLWAWMLLKARFKDNGVLKRGQLFTTIDDMRDAMSYHVGYRKIRPTSKEIRGAYESLTKGNMAVTTKVTHGMVITICNYEYYQDIKNYEGHDEGITTGEAGAQYNRKKVKEGKESKEQPVAISNGSTFDEFWKIYPKKKSKGQAIKAWGKIKFEDGLFDKIIKSLERAKQSKDWLKESGQYIPHPATWLNAMGWEDELAGEPEQSEYDKRFG